MRPGKTETEHAPPYVFQVGELVLLSQRERVLIAEALQRAGELAKAPEDRRELWALADHVVNWWTP